MGNLSKDSLFFKIIYRRWSGKAVGSHIILANSFNLMLNVISVPVSVFVSVSVHVPVYVPVSVYVTVSVPL